jgi:hypothetical protein
MHVCRSGSAEVESVAADFRQGREEANGKPQQRLRGNAEPNRLRLFTDEKTAQRRHRDMVKLGYKLMAEEHGPTALVRGARRCGRPRSAPCW